MKTQHASDASKRDGNATEQYFAAEPSPRTFAVA